MNQFFESNVFQWSTNHWAALSPYLVLCAGIVLTTLAAGFRASKCTHKLLLALIFTGTATAAVLGLGLADVSFFGTSLLLNDMTRWTTLAVVGIGLLASLFVEEEEHGEWTTLLLISTLGLVLLPGARDWVAFFVYLETLAIPGYVIAGLRLRRDGGFEAGLKYLLMGAFASGLLLMGITLVYGAAGSMDYAVLREVAVNGLPSTLLVGGALLIAVSLAFKVALAPMHMWAADIYQSAPTGLAAYLAGAGKVAVFMAMLVAFSACGFLQIAAFTKLFMILGAVSVIVGNLVALSQKNLRRMLAYSSVASAGYVALTLPVGESARTAILLYLVTYALGLLVCFACLEALVRMTGKSSTAALEIGDLKQVDAKKSGVIVTLFSLGIFSMAGIPPLPGFLGKYLMISQLWSTGHVASAIWIIVGSMLGLAYYLKIMVPLYLDSPSGNKMVSLRSSIKGPLASATLGLVLMFVWVWAYSYMSPPSPADGVVQVDAR
ncbi:MAG: NADH-quinone oxidoreductase subunit N [Bdellovibrionota bacterium]